MPGSGAKTQRTAEPHLADHLRHRHPGQRTAIHHRGSGQMRRGSGALQRQNPRGVYRAGAETKTAPLCCGAEYSEWNDFRDPHGQTHQPHEYLAGDESVVHGGRCQPAKGVPA